ncbi:CNH domain-containing protein, partial [Mycena albidolilacea]
VSDAEKKRQEAINEVIYTERDFVRSMEYLRDLWFARLAAADIIPADRRQQFLTQVFWNLHDIITVTTNLRDALNKRQRAYPVVEKIGDIFLDIVAHFQPFVNYGTHQLYGCHELEKERRSNPAFSAFVETTERLPESRKLELQAYLTKPTTRLARYPLLLEAVLKHTPDDSPDKDIIPQVVGQLRTLLMRLSEEAGRTEIRFQLGQLASKLKFKTGDHLDLRLQDEGRKIVHKGFLHKRDRVLEVYLLDNALLFVKQIETKTHEHYQVYRRVSGGHCFNLPDQRTNSKDTLGGQGARQLVRKLWFGSAAPRGSPHPPAVNIHPDAKGLYWISFVYLGRKTYNLVLWANTLLAQRKWVEHIRKQQTVMREQSMLFHTVVLGHGFFSAHKVNCAVLFNGGRRLVYGTDDGVYVSDLQEINKDPVKVLALLDVVQVDILENYHLLIVLSGHQVLTFPLDALNPRNPMDVIAGPKRAERIATQASFFKAGICLGRGLVCIVNSNQGSTTFKAFELTEQNARGWSEFTVKSLFQGGNDTLKPFKEFLIPVESTSIHYLQTWMCIGCSKGFQMVDLDSSETHTLLDPMDESLDFVRKQQNLRPMAIYPISNDFLLCYNEFAFYVNKAGRRSRKEFMVFWEGTPTAFALQDPYVLAFEPSFVEIWHVETGLMSQVIQGSNLRQLCGDTRPSVNNGGGAYSQQSGYDPQYPDQSQHSNPQSVGRDEILMISDDRVLALR